MPEIKIIHYPDKYKDIETLRDEYIRQKYILVSFEKFKSPSEAKKLKDYLLGLSYAKGGVAFQYKKHVLFNFFANGNSEDTLNMQDFVWRDE